MYYKVTDEPDLVRDSNSKAILNVNNDALNKYKKEKEEKLRIKKVLDGYENLKEEIKSTKNIGSTFSFKIFKDNKFCFLR
jgi:hypothetical protein